ncbi:hypothetical protein EYC84_008640 [Monilinia fructicola]|uniref:Uncharacterized protein n=1 Tax=Monilinia fructicola TaxID=38448 RepID=A0A5M9JG36_MONFR|nr:hypothetical protein EYC84_008640 [Monilinia fructicola]
MKSNSAFELVNTWKLVCVAVAPAAIHDAEIMEISSNLLSPPLHLPFYPWPHSIVLLYKHYIINWDQPWTNHSLPLYLHPYSTDKTLPQSTTPPTILKGNKKTKKKEPTKNKEIPLKTENEVKTTR